MLQSETKKWNTESFKFHWKEKLAPYASSCYYVFVPVFLFFFVNFLICHDCQKSRRIHSRAGCQRF